MDKGTMMLLRCPLFQGIDGAEVPDLLHSLNASARRAARGELLWSAGDPVSAMGIVLAGRVQITRADWRGNRSVLTSVGPGEMFGEAFVCAGVETSPVDVAAAEDSMLLLLDARRLTDVQGRGARRLLVNLLRLSAEKNLILSEKLAILARRSTRERLLEYLGREAQRQGGPEIVIPYDRQELADFLEVDRSGLSTEIGKLTREGKLECRKNRFLLR